MDETQAAACMEALGHPKRLAIYRYLVKAGNDGVPVGAVQRALDVPGSTLSHHLSWLVRAGLVIQERRGRAVNCRADYAAMNRVLAFLSAECCAGVDRSDLPGLSGEDPI